MLRWIAPFLLLPMLCSAQVHTSYLWHMQQPIYWPEVSQADGHRYQTVWESELSLIHI